MDAERLRRCMGMRRTWVREMLSECVGTLLLVFLGNCSVAQTVLSSEKAGFPVTIYLAYGLAVTLSVLVAGGGSGAHLNPAVTLALCVVGKHPWRKMPHYVLSQLLGAFLSACLTYLVYLDALYNYDAGIRTVVGDQATASIFTTYPQEYVSLVGAFVDQVLGTMILLLVICAIVDPNNQEIPRYLQALYVGLLVVTIGMALGLNCGYAINPARDLGPRIFVTIAGWGSEAFVYRQYWWVPIAGPCIGGVLGALLYLFLIEIHLPDKKSQEEVTEKA